MVGDGILAKKIKAVTCLVIILVVACAAAAIAVVNAKNVDDVENLVMTENTSNSIQIQWKEVKGADGYHIYSLNNDTKEYEKLGDVKDGQTCSYDFKDAGSGRVYEIKVTAFRIFNKNEYESENAQSLKVYTLPEKLDVSAYSPEEGVLEAKWKQADNAAGYELEYSKNEDFSDSQKEKLSAADFKADKLKPKDTYYVRARAFINVDDNEVFGEWCKPCKAEIKEKIVMNTNIDPKKPVVALSFDDGPAYYDNGSNSTLEILKVLEEYGARATFFMCSSRINKSNSECLKKEIELGCELGNHTYDHQNYGKKVTEQDIVRGSEAIKKACGKNPSIFRCPGGMMTSKIQEVCKKEGMPIAYWSVDTEDWKSRDADKIYKAAMKGVYDGSIILMHDIYPTTAAAVKKIVPKLIEEGYQIVTVSEMLAAKNGGKAPEAGQQYVDYKTVNNNT